MVNLLFIYIPFTPGTTVTLRAKLMTANPMSDIDILNYLYVMIIFRFINLNVKWFILTFTPALPALYYYLLFPMLVAIMLQATE